MNQFSQRANPDTTGPTLVSYLRYNVPSFASASLLLYFGFTLNHVAAVIVGQSFTGYYDFIRSPFVLSSPLLVRLDYRSPKLRLIGSNGRSPGKIDCFPLLSTSITCVGLRGEYWVSLVIGNSPSTPAC